MRMSSVGQEILQKSTTVNYKTKRRANKTWSELGTSVIDMFMFDVAAYPKNIHRDSYRRFCYNFANPPRYLRSRIYRNGPRCDE